MMKLPRLYIIPAINEPAAANLAGSFDLRALRRIAALRFNASAETKETTGRGDTIRPAGERAEIQRDEKPVIRAVPKREPEIERRLCRAPRAITARLDPRALSH